MSLPSTSSTPSPIREGLLRQPEIISIERGILNTPNGAHQVRRESFSPVQKTLLKGLFGFSVINLVIAASIVGHASFSESGEAGASMPFFANSMLGIFGLVMVRNMQLTPQAEPTLF